MRFLAWLWTWFSGWRKYVTIASVLGVTVVLGGFYLHLRELAYRKQIVDLQNQVASRDKTIEVSRGVFRKLAVEETDLKGLLDARDAQLNALKGQLKQGKEQLLAITETSLGWKHAFEGQATGQQTNLSPSAPGLPARAKVEFVKDFGYIGVSGYTLTNPAEAYVKVQQNRPLKLTLAISQSPDGHWNSYVTTNEPNVTVDVGVSGVNPHVLDRRWYERLGLASAAGLGKGGAAVGSVGLMLDVGRFTVGPVVWVVQADQGHVVYGGSMVWRPFARMSP